MTESVQSTVIEIIAKHAELDRNSLNTDTNLEETGIDSLSMVEILFELEEAFDINLPNPTENENTLTQYQTVGSIIDALETHINEKQA